MASPTSGKLLADEETYGPKAQRMVEYQLEARGIHDERVLAEMRSVPRHTFLDSSLRDQAYDDNALPTRHGQTISQPYMVALMTQALAVGPEHTVLEIGTGSGYQTMILARLARRVVTIERDGDLAELARQTLQRFGMDNVQVHVGDGTLGWPEGAPYDRILVTAGAPDLPQSYREQIADGGRIVIPIGDETQQTLTTIERHGEELHETYGTPCRFVPLVGVQGWPSTAS